MRKLICMLLVLVMSLSLAGTVYGNSISTELNPSISQYKDGYIYTEKTPEWYLGIAARENCDAEFVIRYTNEPNILYKV